MEGSHAAGKTGKRENGKTGILVFSSSRLPVFSMSKGFIGFNFSRLSLIARRQRLLLLHRDDHGANHRRRQEQAEDFEGEDVLAHQSLAQRFDGDGRRNGRWWSEGGKRLGLRRGDGQAPPNLRR